MIFVRNKKGWDQLQSPSSHEHVDSDEMRQALKVFPLLLTAKTSERWPGQSCFKLSLSKKTWIILSIDRSFLSHTGHTHTLEMMFTFFGGMLLKTGTTSEPDLIFPAKGCQKLTGSNWTTCCSIENLTNFFGIRSPNHFNLQDIYQPTSNLQDI